MKVTVSIIQYYCAISFTLEKGTAFVKKKEEKGKAKKKVVIIRSVVEWKIIAKDDLKKMVY